MHKTLLYLVTLCAVISICHGLRCRVGATVTDRNKLLLNYNNWTNSECSTDGPPQRCMRGKGEFLAFGNIATNFTGGFCVNITTCNDTCDELANQLLLKAKSDGFSFEIDLTHFTYTALVCERICCNTDNCNDATVSEIRNSLKVVATTTTTTTTTTQGPDVTTQGTNRRPSSKSTPHGAIDVTTEDPDVSTQGADRLPASKIVVFAVAMFAGLVSYILH